MSESGSSARKDHRLVHAPTDDDAARASTRDAIVAALRAGARLIVDGHTIFEVEAYTEEGWPESIVRACVKVHRSSGRNPKGWINGDPDAELEGVYALDFLRHVYHAIGAHHEGRWPFGRGSEARVLADAIKDRLEELPHAAS